MSFAMPSLSRFVSCHPDVYLSTAVWGPTSEKMLWLYGGVYPRNHKSRGHCQRKFRVRCSSTVRTVWLPKKRAGINELERYETKKAKKVGLSMG